VKTGQDEALEEFHKIAKECGVVLPRPSTCYPPTCRMHVHTEDEKRRFAEFAVRLAASTKRSTKPRLDEEEKKR